MKQAQDFMMETLVASRSRVEGANHMEYNSFITLAWHHVKHYSGVMELQLMVKKGLLNRTALNNDILVKHNPNGTFVTLLCIKTWKGGHTTDHWTYVLHLHLPLMYANLSKYSQLFQITGAQDADNLGEDLGVHIIGVGLHRHALKDFDSVEELAAGNQLNLGWKTRIIKALMHHKRNTNALESHYDNSLAQQDIAHAVFAGGAEVSEGQTPIDALALHRDECITIVKLTTLEAIESGLLLQRYALLKEVLAEKVLTENDDWSNIWDTLSDADIHEANQMMASGVDIFQIESDTASGLATSEGQAVCDWLLRKVKGHFKLRLATVCKCFNTFQFATRDNCTALTTSEVSARQRKHLEAPLEMLTALRNIWAAQETSMKMLKGQDVRKEQSNKPNTIPVSGDGDGDTSLTPLDQLMRANLHRIKLMAEIHEDETEYVHYDGYSIVSQVHSTPAEVWSSIDRESHGAWVNPVEPEVSVTGDSDKENITPDHRVIMRSSIDREIFGKSDAELSTSDHPDITTLSREDSPIYIPRTPEPREPSIFGSDWSGELQYPSDGDQTDELWGEEDFVVQARRRLHELYTQLEAIHSEECACRHGYGPID
ncbi:hypothetical protein HWV62_14426 [Athelia sp. TMB]|nr:hypothetical protein HWV62_14426 [Athelia sp. TMB]